MECTLRGIFQTHFEAYAREHKQPAYVHRAAYWISRCRTAELGGHVRRCPEGHVERAFYNSCHQRGCAQCQALATEQWLERQRARLIACAHHHVIFTIPHELNALWCWNRAGVAKLLFGAAREVLFELLEDPQYLGATPAFLSALHTWGRSLSLHPHVHVLIADGGLSDEGTWVKARRSHFLPAPVVMLLFRGKLLDALKRALERGELRVPADSSRERVRSTLNHVGRKKWNVHIRARYAHGAGVAAYLARYLKGGPLKNTQLIDTGEAHVAFRYRPHRDEDDAGENCRIMTLTPEAFLARYLAHIPCRGCKPCEATAYTLSAPPPHSIALAPRSARRPWPRRSPSLPRSSSPAFVTPKTPAAVPPAARSCCSPPSLPMPPDHPHCCTEPQPAPGVHFAGLRARSRPASSPHPRHGTVHTPRPTFGIVAPRGEWKGYRSSRLGIQFRIIYRVVPAEQLFQVIAITAHDYRRP